MKKSIIKFLFIMLAGILIFSCQQNEKQVIQTEIEEKAEFDLYKDLNFDLEVIYEPLPGLKAGKDKNGTWEYLTDVPRAFEGGNAGIIDGKIIATMGYPPSPATHIFDLETKTWTMGNPAPGTSSEGASVTHGGVLYCVGGRTISNRLWAYDAMNDSWAMLPPMSVARNGLAVATVGDSLFAIGGRTGPTPLSGNALDVVEMYDIVNQVWTTVAPLPSPRADLAAAAMGGKIYVFGGFDYSTTPKTALGDVDVYDPNTDTWSTAPADMPTPRGALYAVGTKGNEVYVIGGHVGGAFNTAPGGTGTIVEAYKVSSDTWKDYSNFSYMPTARAEACVASHGGRIYMIGGAQPWAGVNSLRNVEVFKPVK